MHEEIQGKEHLVNRKLRLLETADQEARSKARYFLRQYVESMVIAQQWESPELQALLAEQWGARRKAYREFLGLAEGDDGEKP